MPTNQSKQSTPKLTHVVLKLNYDGSLLCGNKFKVPRAYLNEFQILENQFLPLVFKIYILRKTGSGV